MKGSKRRRRGVDGSPSLRGWQAGLALAMYCLLGPFLMGQTQPEGALEGPWERGLEGPWKNNAPTSTGPAVGEKIPFFRAPDQHGRTQDFQSIRGPQGAVIVFNRSVDW